MPENSKDELLTILDEKRIPCVTIRSPRQLLKVAQKHIQQYPNESWAYRGVSAAEHLMTTFGRAARMNGVAKHKSLACELRMVRSFARDFPGEAAATVPGRGETLDLLAVMQHYGAPTRLLDFTYSPLAAAFFALNRAGAEQKCAVLAVETQWLQDAARQLLNTDFGLGDRFKRMGRFFDSKAFRDIFFRKDQVRFVCAVNACRRNRRLRAQKGVFMVPGSVECSFLANLCGMNGYQRSVVAYLLPPSSNRRRVWSDAFQLAGMTNYSLFPDLQGVGDTFWREMIYLSERDPKKDPIEADDLAYF